MHNPSQFERPTDVEYTFICFNIPKTSYLLCAYLPPSLSADTVLLFRQHVSNIFNHVLELTPDADLFLCGDFNRYDLAFLTRECYSSSIVLYFCQRLEVLLWANFFVAILLQMYLMFCLLCL